MRLTYGPDCWNKRLLLLTAVLIGIGRMLGPPEQLFADEPASPSEARQFLDVPYGRVPQYQSLDLYLPATSEQKAPLVVWIHGGAWRAGDKAMPPTGMLRANGFAVASINYRLSSVAPYPAQLQDCQAAIRFLRANSRKYGLDPNRIGVWGASAGGHLAAMLGVLSSSGGSSNRVQAICDCCGPTDLVNAIADAPQDSPLNIREVLWQLFLGPKFNDPNLRQSINSEQRRRLLASASPIQYASRKSPPFLVVHGDADNIVPIIQSERFVAALREAQANVEFLAISGAGHDLRDRADCMDAVLAFFQKHLANSSPP